MRAGPGHQPNTDPPKPSPAKPPLVDALRQNLGTFWSEDCQAFLAHWAGLRREGLMPTTESFLDHPDQRFAPHIYIVELIGDVARVRLQGTGLDKHWPDALTGHDLHEGLSPRARSRSVENMRRLLTQPCGFLARNAYTTTLNRTATADLMQLPLAVQEGRPPRLVCLALMPRPEDFEDDLNERVAGFRTEKLAWFDFGAGVPSTPPHELLS